MTWDDIKKRHARATHEALVLVDILLEFIRDRKERETQGKLEFIADNNGVVNKGDKIEHFEI